MTSGEIRKKYLDFFKSKGHAVIPSASLIPENDPSVLFTTAGMHPLVPYLLGEKHPQGVRLVNVQKCIRTGDIDEVGNYSHHTFFEMLGNWSLGDYFKKEAIGWSYEFLTSSEWLGLDKNRLAVSVFEGDDDASFDSEAFEIWKNLGIPEKRVARLPKKNNWWGPAGETGPCGPDTEMFYWAGDPDKVPESFNDDNPLWLEIWNDVFMQYNKIASGKFESLSQKNVDTGMGLERVLAVANGLDDNYKTELFWPILEKIQKISGKKYDGENIKAMRIIADHIKAAVFILGDERGVAPSNTGQGYVLRRLIRRTIRYGRELGLKNFTKEISEAVMEIYKDTYFELEKNKEFIFSNLGQEEEKFRKTLDLGLKELKKLMSGKFGEMTLMFDGADYIVDVDSFDAISISGKDLFIISTTYGFPFEMCLEELSAEINKAYLKNRRPLFDVQNTPLGKRLVSEFNEEFRKHQELSRTASAGMFKGGLADTSEQTTRLHTAAHLMLAGLRKILGPQISQKGSNITPERLRFDFNYDGKMAPEQIKQVEDFVNDAIDKKFPVRFKEVTLDEARAMDATGVFGSKYGEKVKVYTIGPSASSGQDKGDDIVSREICGGPHVSNTGELSRFKIVKEESASAGTRRIRAVIEG